MNRIPLKPMLWWLWRLGVGGGFAVLQIYFIAYQQTKFSRSATFVLWRVPCFPEDLQTLVYILRALPSSYTVLVIFSDVCTVLDFASIHGLRPGYSVSSMFLFRGTDIDEPDLYNI